MSAHWRDIVTVGQPKVMARWRTDLQWPDQGLPLRINFAVSLRDQDAEGLPTPEETVELDRLEDALTPVFEEHGAVVALVVTTGGQREWVSYAARQDWVEPWAAEFAEGFLAGRAHLVGSDLETGWDTYAMFAGQMPRQPFMQRRWLPKGWWRPRR